MARPATSAIGKEEKRATSAVARAARMRLVITDAWRVMIGAIRIAARPARAEPSAQLIVAMRSGDQPIDDAARSFSATAAVASPKRVKRYSAQSPTVSSTAIA